MFWRAYRKAALMVTRGMREEDLCPDPFEQTRRWLAEAERARLPLPNAAALATADSDGRPSARMVLVKGIDDGSWCFYTNYESRKARDLEANPWASLLLHWHIFQRQIRLDGRAERMSAEASAAYFRTRPRGSQIAAWASRQSEPAASRADLERAVREVDERFKGQEVPCPPFWGGYRVVGEEIEFWQGRAFRVHDRVVFRRAEGGGWTPTRLQP